MRLRLITFALLMIALTGCGASAQFIVPTDRPTATPTRTLTPAPTLDSDATPTIPPTQPPMTATGGPSPTPLFGAALATAIMQPTVTEDPLALNPNAPRIEFFTSDAVAVAPGGVVRLYWSTRGAADAIIYQLDRGVRNQLWNVEPDGNLPVQTSRNDRGTLEFVLIVGTVEQTLSVPLACPDGWFFNPPPEACPTRPAQQTRIIEQPFQVGRMVYVETEASIFALFNDGFAPAWLNVEDRYNPAIHPESEPNFPVPPGFYQPLRRLGFVWRGSDAVRNRLGLGAQPEFVFDGFVQTSQTPEGAQTLYISSSDGAVLQLLPGGSAWQIITSPS